MSDQFEFTATHGVSLADLQVQFERDFDAEGVVYKFATSDAKQAEALQKVKGYGIELTAKPEKPRALSAAEKKAAKEAAEQEALEATEREADEQAAASRPDAADQK